MRGAWALALGLGAALLAACERGPREVLVDRDDRYRVTLHVQPPGAPQERGELRLRVETAENWKIAPEAPARLALRANGLVFEPSELLQADVQNLHDGGFEFAAALRAEREGRQVAHAELHFGVCEEKVLVCEVVRRDLVLPIEVRFP